MPEGFHVDDPPAMTVREVAGYLNVDEKTVYRLAKRGELPGATEAPKGIRGRNPSKERSLRV
jgi:transposase